MEKRTVLAGLFALGQAITAASPASAASANASGAAALALAGVVAGHSPVLSSTDRRVMARLFADRPVTFPADRKLTVAASSIECRISSTDIASRTCELRFDERRHGARTVGLSGRAASEVFAALTAAGAGSGEVAKVSALSCTIDPNEIRRRAGGGADCVFEKGG